jgi:16S rRNA (uracil1498-N3)-methyltransferase
VRSDGVVFSRKNAHYLQRVLRLEPGDLLEVMDGRNRLMVRLCSHSPGNLGGTIEESIPIASRAEPGTTLALACVRPGPVEDVLRHGTELGVGRFVPILSRRAVRRPFEVKQRWVSITAAAAAQSGRVRVPALDPPVSLADFLSALAGQQARLLLSTQPNALPILSCLDRISLPEVIVLAGPEGGFEPSEESNAVECGFTPVSLGSGILRSETAAVAALATVLVWRHWRDSGSNEPCSPEKFDRPGRP